MDKLTKFRMLCEARMSEREQNEVLAFLAEYRRDHIVLGFTYGIMLIAVISTILILTIQ